MSDNAQVDGAITAIYRRNMGTIIERWERHITAAGPDVAPGVPEEELARFRGLVSNLNNVRQFLERWEGEEGDVEEGLGEGEKGEVQEVGISLQPPPSHLTLLFVLDHHTTRVHGFQLYGGIKKPVQQD